MSTKLTDPNDLLSEMEEPIQMIRGAQDALSSMGYGVDVTPGSIRFIADALFPPVKRLEELWRQWAKLHHGDGEKEG